MWVASAWNPNTNLNERSFFFNWNISSPVIIPVKFCKNINKFQGILNVDLQPTVDAHQNPLIRFISKPFFSTFRLLKTSTMNRQCSIKMISSKNTCFMALVFGNILFEYQRKWIRKTACPRSIILNTLFKWMPPTAPNLLDRIEHFFYCFISYESEKVKLLFQWRDPWESNQPTLPFAIEIFRCSKYENRKLNDESKKKWKRRKSKKNERKNHENKAKKWQKNHICIASVKELNCVSVKRTEIYSFGADDSKMVVPNANEMQNRLISIPFEFLYSNFSMSSHFYSPQVVHQLSTTQHNSVTRSRKGNVYLDRKIHL